MDGSLDATERREVVDPFVLEREWAANVLELIAKHDQALVDVILASSTASPMCRELGAWISSRAAGDLARARRVRSGDLALRDEEAPLRLVR